MRPQRAVINVSALPTLVFGSRAPSWWGIVCFMAVESTSLAICVATYFYLSKNFSAWPPEDTRAPALLVPTISLIALLASNGLALAMDRAAKARNFGRTRVLLVVATIVGVGLFGLRLFEFRSLNTTWDANAYGSTIWTIMGLHSSLLLMEVMETGGLALVYLFGRAQPKHFTHASENAIYWMFSTLSWVPLYAVIFWGPKLL
jgi:heme/copper-type cytochrome/quinol oxidase subunit 3